jgi:hypothetical protein
MQILPWSIVPKHRKVFGLVQMTSSHPLINSLELLDSYLNGPRTLSDKRLSYLVVSSTDKELDGKTEGERSFDLLICSTHFLGDGMALHQFAHEFLGLVSSNTDDAGLLEILEAEISSRRAKSADEGSPAQVPLSLEERLPQSPGSKFQNAAAVVDHLSNQRQQIVRLFQPISPRPS